MKPIRVRKECDCYNCRAAKMAAEVEGINDRIQDVYDTFVFTEDMEKRHDALQESAHKIAAEIRAYNAKAMIGAMIGGQKPEHLPAELVERIKKSNAEALAFAEEVEAYAARPEIKLLAQARMKRYREMQYTGRAIQIRLDRLNAERKITPEQAAAVQAAADELEKSSKALREMGVWDTALMDWHERDTARFSDALAAVGY